MISSSSEPLSDNAAFRQAISSFNRAHFFEAHELFEDLWRSAPGEQKLFFQGLVQMSVAFHHHSQGNLMGAESVLKRALRNLSGYPEHFGGIELTRLRQSLQECVQAFTENTPPPSLPQLKVTKTSKNV
ncbi:MAG: DUF309 domain-containing protein [Acidobacteriaceae bacterium]